MKKLSQTRTVKFGVESLAYTLTATVCFLMLTASILAPYCLAHDLPRLGAILKFSLSLMCHQYPTRCLDMFGIKTALCARCFSFYAAIMILSVAKVVFKRSFKSISLKLLIVMVLPLVIDGTTQLIGLRSSTNTIRVITGGLAGFGTGVAILSYVATRFSTDDYIC